MFTANTSRWKTFLFEFLEVTAASKVIANFMFEKEKKEE